MNKTNERAAGPFATVEEALAELSAGRVIVVIDDEDRENEGDLTCAAEFATPETINFMAKYGRGLICLTLTEERADAMRLGPMTQDNTSRFGTAFTESIEAREGVTTGISAADRAHTIAVAISPRSTAADLARPGHVFPLRARKGGVLVRAGQTEASVDLARMAGLIPAAVICEIMNDDGSMARVPDLLEFCSQHGLKMITVAELIRYRLQHERYVQRVGEALVPTRFGEFTMIAYESEVGPGESHTESHVAFVKGDLRDHSDRPVLVRVQSHCFPGAILGADTCDCRDMIDASLSQIAEAGRGALIYLHAGQRGFSVENAGPAGRLVFHREARLLERGAGQSSESAHRILRQVGLGGQILSDLGVRKIELLTNRPTHIPALQGFGIEISGQRRLQITPAQRG